MPVSVPILTAIRCIKFAQAATARSTGVQGTNVEHILRFTSLGALNPPALM